ncbi:MAG TPA: P-loop NTPase fold protein, partial [Flavobacterium sp.]|nr:P-loop NTPase fold protein [Flavobacterium sp.]
RKAILIELTEFIADAKRKIVKEPDKWGDKQKRLLSKHKEVTTTNTPYLSIGFILSLFLIIYIPTVNTFAKDLSSLWLKSLLVLLPLLLLPIIFGIKFCRNLKKSGQNEKKRFLGSIKLSIQQTMQIYGNKQTDETKFELISENEPSVKDFRDWMRDIDSDLATNNKNLVIVFDNFDRLPKKNIQSIWSSVHIFFSDEKYKKIKVLIPFDRNHIKTAFREHNDNSTEVDYANDYINKTFDLVYRISPPIMSNWKAFFKTCWDNAFQGVFGDDEYIKSEQAYEAYCKTITPREIIAFINEVVSLKLIHPNIPTRYISVFVLNKYSILKDPLKAIVEKSFLASLSYQYKDDEEFSKFITALSYQIDPDNALEIVYRGKLKEALTSSDVNDLNEISKTLVFSKIIFPLLEEIENFDKPLLALSQLTSEAKISAVEKQHLWDNIYLLQKDKNIEEAHLTEPQKLLFQNVGTVYKKTWAKKIIDGIYNHQDFSSLKFADAIDGLSNICSDNAYGIDLNEMLAEKIVPASDFIPLIKNKKAQYEKYRIQVDGDELDQYLSEHVMVNDTDIVQYLTKRYTLETFKVALTTKINEYKSDQVQLAVLFKTLKNLHKNRSNININSLLRDADIYSLFTNSKPTEDFYFDLIAMRIARGLNFDPSYQAPFVSILNTPDETITNKVAERVEYYISHDDLLMSSLDFSNELVKNVVRNIVKTSYQTQFASVSTLIKAFDRICKTNEIDPSIFITHLDGWPPPEFDKPLVKSIPESFYINAQASDCDLAKLALAGLKNYFLELTEEEWVSIFENTKQEDFRLLQALQYSDWNSFSLEALKKVLLKICKTGIIGNQSDMHAVLES